MLNPFAPASREDVMCTVRVVNTFENLAAHVELDDGVTVEPGDEVLVHGKPIIAYSIQAAQQSGLFDRVDRKSVV